MLSVECWVLSVKSMEVGPETDYLCKKIKPMKISKPAAMAVMMALMATITLQAYSQAEIKAGHVKMTMSMGEQPGFQVIIPQAVQDDVKREWIKYVQSGTKSKAVELGSEISISGAMVKEASPNPVDVYAIIEMADSNVSVTAFFVIDSAMYDPEKGGSTMTLAMEDYMEVFGVSQYEAAVENELKMEENKLKDLEKQLSDLEKNEEKMEKSIKDEEEKISRAEEEIKILEASKAQQLTVIEEKRVAASTIIEKETKKEAEKEIKALEKEREKSDKSLSKEKENIDDAKRKIEDYEKAIEEGQEQQEELKGMIEAQEEVVQQVEEKLKGIR